MGVFKKVTRVRSYRGNLEPETLDPRGAGIREIGGYVGVGSPEMRLDVPQFNSRVDMRHFIANVFRVYRIMGYMGILL